MVTPAFLELRDITKSFEVTERRGTVRHIQVISSISRTVEEGHFISVVGPSGCGKSTLLEMIAGLSRVSSGQLLLKGAEIREPHPSLGVVFQEESIFPWLTAKANVEFGLKSQRIGADQCNKRAVECLTLVGLSGFENAYPRQLSGGMRQRVAIARALALEPDILLMDEPFGAVDPQTRMFIGMELRRIWQETGKTIIFITHDINEAVFLSQEVWVMSHRPSTLLEVVDVDLPDERDVSILGDKLFMEYTGHLWAIMQQEWDAIHSEGMDDMKTQPSGHVA